MKNITNIPVWFIICGSLFITYLILFVRPVFLNSAHSMFFPHYVPSVDPIGCDLRATLFYSVEWMKWMMGCTPYAGGSLYPPLANVFFSPLAALRFPVAYFLVTVVSVAAFVSVALALPLASCQKPDRTALIVLTFAGLLSYGFQFEIERGQSNVLAGACCAWAIFLFHSGNTKWVRLGAYLLFTVAIQLKLYPAIFVFAFARNGRDWKRNLVRWTALGVVNIALLFALGPQVFRGFLVAVTAQITNPFVWIGNHSIKSFVILHQPGTGPFTSFLGLGCVLTLTVCFVSILALVYVRNVRWSFKYLVAICGLSAMLIPSASHDYKLPILSMAFAMFVGETGPIMVNRFSGVIMAVLLFTLGMLYAWTLFSFTFKPFLQNNAPVLLSACIVLVVIMLTEEMQKREIRRSSESTVS